MPTCRLPSYKDTEIDSFSLHETFGAGNKKQGGGGLVGRHQDAALHSIIQVLVNPRPKVLTFITLTDSLVLALRVCVCVCVCVCV